MANSLARTRANPVDCQYQTTPDIDRNKLTVEVMTDHQMLSDKLEVKVLEGKQLVAVGSSVNGIPVEIAMPSDVSGGLRILRFYMIWKFVYIQKIS